MSYINKYFGKDPDLITHEDIDSFINKKIEENVNLEYKSIPKKLDFEELAKDVSAFANSEGGLLILGVSEKEELDQKTKKTYRIYPKEITWGEPSLTKEKIEQNLIGKIHPLIEDFRIVPIQDQQHNVIFLIDVPQSKNSPHMATPNNKYYKRLNFENQPMGHYEVQNLFRINWIMREKLIEKIFEPLSKVLGKHIKELEDYSCPSIYDVDKCLSNTYYTYQLPMTFFEDLIDPYIEGVNDFNKKMHYVRIEIERIIARNVFNYLKKTYDHEVDIKFQAITGDGSSVDLYEMHKILLKNKKIKPYLEDAYFRQVYVAIAILYNNEYYKVDLDEFEKSIWNKCLVDAYENYKINQMKESIEALLDGACNIINAMTEY